MKKKVNKRELNFMKITEENNISPEILYIGKIKNDLYSVEIEQYPYTLSDYYDKGKDISKYEKQIKKLVKKLHKLGIIHGDLHGNNIVIDPKTNEVKLIDFGMSYFIDEVDKSVIKKLNKLLDPKDEFENIDDVLDFEFTMYKLDL